MYRQESSKQEFTDELREILEVTARTGLYWYIYCLTAFELPGLEYHFF